MKADLLWDISSKLVGFNTVSCNDNQQCSSLIANFLKDLGFQVSLEQTNEKGIIKEQVIACIGPKVKGGLILSGHMDTVPFENQPGWERDALKLELSEDKVFGRGSCDMKLFIAHCLLAFKNLDLTKLKKPIVCFFTNDEEIGCHGAKRIADKIKDFIDDYPLPEYALIGEPTSFQIINTHKGLVHSEIVIEGKGGHSSRPDLGQNTISPLGKIITIIDEINHEYEQNIDSTLFKLFPDFPRDYIHMAMVNAGLAGNMIPEKCRLTITYRTFPGQDPFAPLDKLKERITHAGIQKLHFENTMQVPASPLASHTEFEKVLKEITSKEEMQSVSFATDAGYFSQLGINCYICGPGEIAMAHKPNEYMPVADYIAGVEFVEKILRKTVL